MIGILHASTYTSVLCTCRATHQRCHNHCATVLQHGSTKGHPIVSCYHLVVVNSAFCVFLCVYHIVGIFIYENFENCDPICKNPT